VQRDMRRVVRTDTRNLPFLYSCLESTGYTVLLPVRVGYPSETWADNAFAWWVDRGSVSTSAHAASTWII